MQLLKNEIEGVCLCDTFKNLDVGMKWDFEKLYFNVYFRGGRVINNKAMQRILNSYEKDLKKALRVMPVPNKLYPCDSLVVKLSSSVSISVSVCLCVQKFKKMDTD